VDPPGLTSLGPIGAAASACLGAIVGSFLNVVIARVPRGESIVSPGSRCPRCGAPIAWYDNVPIVSWMLLRARCRRCRARIPVRYPLVEALVAAAGYAAWIRHGPAAPLVAELAFVALLVALAFVDLDTWLLPHALTWPLIALGLAASALGLSPASLRASLIGGAAGFAAFAAVAWVGRLVLRREALGFGDVWLLSGLGAFLGATALLPVVLLASLQGSVVGIALVLLGRSTPGARPPEPDPGGTAPPAGPAPGSAPPVGPAPASAPPAGPQAAEEDWIPPRHAVPFGPFLALGALEWLYLADRIVRLIPPLGAFR
jgi:leader peptidase (prepilin peptidase)/N-methyltransferase